jgi:hypothetical protein
MMQLIPYHHRSPTAWLDALPLALRAALQRPRAPESDPEVLRIGGIIYVVHAPRVDLRSGGWRRWLKTPEGAAWLETPPGQRWAKGARGAKWAAREGVASCGC